MAPKLSVCSYPGLSLLGRAFQGGTIGKGIFAPIERKFIGFTARLQSMLVIPSKLGEGSVTFVKREINFLVKMSFMGCLARGDKELNLGRDWKERSERR